MSLHQFEGRDVLQTPVRITRAGDGLSRALLIDPTEYRIGDQLFVLLEVEVDDVTHKRIPETDALMRRHSFAAGIATVVDGKWAKDAITKQRKANLEAAGVTELPGLADDE